MKYLLTTILLLGFMVTNAQNAIDGTWKGSRETPNGTMKFNIHFQSAGRYINRHYQIAVW